MIVMDWWSLLKAVDVDFEFLPDSGFYGAYNRRDDKITINLSAFGSDRDKRGMDNDDFQREQDIVETIMHEGGHAAALGKEYADLADELFNWAGNRVAEFMEGKGEDIREIRPQLIRIIDYLINEYIAAIIEGTYGKNRPNAMKNAYDQTIAANSSDFAEMVFFFNKVFEEEPDVDIGEAILMNMIMGAPTSWEVSDYLIPLFDKYMNNMGQIIMGAYKEGTSFRDKENFKELTGETPNPKVRGTMFTPPSIRERMGQSSENWMERLRGE